MERNNKLPEKWYIKGCSELIKYLKTADNNPNKILGVQPNFSYQINENGDWCCRYYTPDSPYQEITLQQYLNSFKPNNNTNMKSIEIPEGYNLNLEKLIELGILTKPNQEEPKKIAETYQDIIKDFDSSNISSFIILDNNKHSNVEAFVRLLNTASYLNKMYEKDDDEICYFTLFEDELYTEYTDQTTVYDSRIYFNSTHAINNALEILGEETIKLALKFN